MPPDLVTISEFADGGVSMMSLLPHPSPLPPGEGAISTIIVEYPEDMGRFPSPSGRRRRMREKSHILVRSNERMRD